METVISRKERNDFTQACPKCKSFSQFLEEYTDNWAFYFCKLCKLTFPAPFKEP